MNDGHALPRDTAPDTLGPLLDAIADRVVARLAPVIAARAPALPAAQGPEFTWRERLWLVPAETRLGVREAAEALGRPVSWLYRHTSPKALAKADRTPVPHRKLDGELVFTAGELRSWLDTHEARVEPGADVP